MKQTLTVIIVIVICAGVLWYAVPPGHDHDHDHPHEHDHEHGHEHSEEHTDADDLVAKEPVRADGNFTIAASFYPLAFALERLTEDRAEVTNIGGSRDPHDVQLSTQDVAAMQTADLVVLQGAALEPWGEDMIEQLATENVPVLVATHGRTLMEGGHDHHDDKDERHEEGEHEHESEEVHTEEESHEDESLTHDEHDHDHGAYDPHTWLDPVLFSETVADLVSALVTLDPENGAQYETRGAALQAELASLDQAYTTGLASCEFNQVITSHDAFGYIGERYGFTIHTIAGLSTQDLPSVQTLASLREEAEAGVGAILLEENSVAAYGETLASETGLQTLSINPIAYLVPEGEDYLTLMRANLETFRAALQCT